MQPAQPRPLGDGDGVTDGVAEVDRDSDTVELLDRVAEADRDSDTVELPEGAMSVIRARTPV